MGLLDQPVYEWQDIKSNGAKNPRAKKKKKLTDQEYLNKVSRKNTPIKDYYAQTYSPID